MPKVRIVYATDGPGGRITLTGREVDPLGEMEKTADAVLLFLASAGRDAAAGEIVKAVPRSPQTGQPTHDRSVRRALKYLVESGAIAKVRQGVYRLPEGGEEPSELPF
jgi:repressor of nif and glnA expression